MGAEGHVPPEIREKYFSGNYYVKFGHFSDKNHVKFGNFVIFFGKILRKFGYYVHFSGKNRVTFGHLVNFSYIFLGKNVVPT